MSCILAIELSTPRGHIVLWRDGTVVIDQAFTSHRSHNSMLYAPLSAALEVAGDSLQSIVVGLGPGSYTGVRISIAAAQGVAISRGVPISGLPSIVALSEASEYLVIGDARRGKFYTAHIRDGRMIEGITLHDEAALRTWLDIRPGLPRFTSDATPPLGDDSIVVAHPSAVLLASHAENQLTPATDLLEPLYVQEAFITQAKTPTMGAGR